MSPQSLKDSYARINGERRSRKASAIRFECLRDRDHLPPTCHTDDSLHTSLTMSTINRLLSRKDKHHGNHKEKVPASPARVPSTSTSASISTKSPHAPFSSSSLYAISLAFATLLPKRSPRLQATIEPIQCSSANHATLLLQPKQHGGPLHGHSVPEENQPNEEPEKEGDGKVLWSLW